MREQVLEADSSGGGDGSSEQHQWVEDGSSDKDGDENQASTSGEMGIGI